MRQSGKTCVKQRCSGYIFMDLSRSSPEKFFASILVKNWLFWRENHLFLSRFLSEFSAKKNFSRKKSEINVPRGTLFFPKIWRSADFFVSNFTKIFMPLFYLFFPKKSILFYFKLILSERPMMFLFGNLLSALLDFSFRFISLEVIFGDK